MITQQEAKKILQLLQSTDKVNRALGKELLQSQKIWELVALEMLNQVEGDFYGNHSRTHILHHFTGELLFEYRKHILNKVEELISGGQLLPKYPELEEHLSSQRFKRVLSSELATVFGAEQLSTPKQFIHSAEKLSQIIRLMVIIQPSQCVIYLKREAYSEQLKALIVELAYLNSIADNREQLKQIYREVIKGGYMNGVSYDGQPPLLTYVDLVRRTQFPLLLLVLPSDQPNKRDYVLKVTIKFKSLLRKKN